KRDLVEAKEGLENLNNQLKVDDMMFIELEAKKDELAEEQKYVVLAIKGEIMLQNNNISELEVGLKLLYKKHEILKRDWDF
ncbi:MAG: hypothetical protein Athens101428_704, partial [Candidatus Berkelbacteria bacterium Athens1014_28]